MVCRSLRARGFTLIELLVVLVIIGILISVAVLSLGDGGKRDRLQQEGRRLAALIELASDNAVLQGQEWGLRIEENGYSFMVLQDGVWQPVSKDNMFRTRQLAEGFSLKLHMEDVAVSLVDTAVASEDAKRQPQLFLMSSAERTPFEIVLVAPGGEPQLRLEAPLSGEVVLHEARTH